MSLDLKTYIDAHVPPGWKHIRLICVEIHPFSEEATDVICDLLCGHADSVLYSSLGGTSSDRTKIRDFSLSEIPKNAVDVLFFVSRDDDEQVVSMFSRMRGGGIMILDLCDTDRFLQKHGKPLETLYREGTRLITRILKPATFDVFTLNWNQAYLLPYFLHYYRQASEITILDNESDDDSDKIVAQYGRRFVSFSTGGTLNDRANQHHKNHCWKQSLADYVIVQDLDEFLFFPYPHDLVTGFTERKSRGITIGRSLGYQMFCSDRMWERVPHDQLLPASLWNGSAECIKNGYDKVLFFDPRRVQDLFYSPGAHYCQPAGELNADPSPSFLLHYKYMGKEKTLQRSLRVSQRVSETNRKEGLGTGYFDAEALLNTYREYFRLYSDHSVFSVLYPDPTIAPFEYQERRCILKTFGESDIISHALLHKHIWEPRVAAFIYQYVQEHPTTTYLDIGCNVGAHLAVAKLAGASRIFAFECNPTTFGMLSTTIQWNGWEHITLYPQAVSDTCDQELEFVDSVFGNLGASYIYYPKNHTGHQRPDRKVRTITIDSIRHGLSDAPLLIKMDIEGHELHALRGMSHLLQERRGNIVCIIKLNPFIIYTPVHMETMIKELSSFFSEASVLYSTTTDPWYGSILTDTIEFPRIRIEDLFPLLSGNNHICEIACFP